MTLVFGGVSQKSNLNNIRLFYSFSIFLKLKTRASLYFLIENQYSR